MVLFKSFDMIDIFGPLDPLFHLAFSEQLNLALIADTLDPVSVAPVTAALNRENSSFWPSINPTHTFDTAPEDLKVLLVPAGSGSHLGNVSTSIEFVAKTYPKLKYLITTCTGAGIAARTGVLDGRGATTNKAAWNTIAAMVLRCNEYLQHDGY